MHGPCKNGVALPNSEQLRCFFRYMNHHQQKTRTFKMLNTVGSRLSNDEIKY